MFSSRLSVALAGCASPAAGNTVTAPPTKILTLSQELLDVGFSASVIAEGDGFPSTAGVVVRVHKRDPYGVALEWHAPVVDSEQYQREVLEQVHKPAVTGRLIRHVSEVNEIATKAAFGILKDAGFRTMMDYIERCGYYYRVLSAPADQ